MTKLQPRYPLFEFQCNNHPNLNHSFFFIKTNGRNLVVTPRLSWLIPYYLCNFGSLQWSYVSCQKKKGWNKHWLVVGIAFYHRIIYILLQALNHPSFPAERSLYKDYCLPLVELFFVGRPASSSHTFDDQPKMRGIHVNSHSYQDQYPSKRSYDQDTNILTGFGNVQAPKGNRSPEQPSASDLRYAQSNLQRYVCVMWEHYRF